MFVVALRPTPYWLAVERHAPSEWHSPLTWAWRVAGRRHVSVALLTACLLVVAWLIAAPRSPDLAAQVYRFDLFKRVGFSLWDNNWYGGHYLPGYSLLFPWVALLLGLRLVGALAVLASTVAFERLVLGVYGERARWGATCFAVAAAGDIWIGRLTFALGVTFAVSAVLALARGRPWLATVLAALCAATSPVAGLLLALAGATHMLAERRLADALPLVVPTLAVVLALEAIFPEGGWEPFAASSVLATVAVTLAFLWALPGEQRLLRSGAIVYLVVTLLAILPTPMGANIARYGVLLAGPLLLCALAGRAQPGAGDRSRLALTLVVGGIVMWVVWGPVREVSEIVGDPSTNAAYYAPVKRFLAAHGGSLVRIEVPFTHSHWEAALLAPGVSLARGWERQLDTRYDPLFFRGRLTSSAYRAWLERNAVSFVALPDVRLDGSSTQEARLIRGGLPYLRAVFSSRNWIVYEVLDPTPLALGPGRLSQLGHESFTLQADRPGSFTVRVHYTRFWAIARGSGCVGPASGGWTSVRADAPGMVSVVTRFSLGRALGFDGACGPGTLPGRVVRGRARRADYRWLVPTEGRPPSIAAENRARGTSSWRLPGPATLIGGVGHGRVEGYVAEQALAPGQSQRVYVNAPDAHKVRLRVYRMGWYGGLGGRLVLESRPLPVARQPPCAHRFSTGLTECAWRATLSFPIPRALTSGVYIVKMIAGDGSQRDCLFVVRAEAEAPLLVQIPTASYEAYNAWGGDSLYPGGAKRVGVTGTNQGVEVSYDRPYGDQTGAGQFFIREVAMVRFLERYGYPASYTTSESIDGDPAQVLGHRALIDVGHSEYWSQREERAFVGARDRGTSLIFISSDTMAWRVRFHAASAASSQAGEPDHVIVGYKQSARADPDRFLPTGLFPGGGASLVGRAYDGCITSRLKGPGPPVYRYYPWAPAPALRPAWLFAGSGVSAATRIPGIVGYELDQRTPDTPAGTQLVGMGSGVRCMFGREPSPFSGALAQSTLYTARSRALVFATGTLGWAYGLSPVPQASADVPRAPDPRIVRITRNLLARVLGDRAPRSG